MRTGPLAWAMSPIQMGCTALWPLLQAGHLHIRLAHLVGQQQAVRPGLVGSLAFPAKGSYFQGERWSYRREWGLALRQQLGPAGQDPAVGWRPEPENP
mmetsp:Transcript_30099/g.71674  ORF Transcript_30099/g.71674 Transcript_30099/m.71674 type:complete len:98 (-) Transcript_30099:1088-1381(-)